MQCSSQIITGTKPLPIFLQAVCHPTNCVKALKAKPKPVCNNHRVLSVCVCSRVRVCLVILFVLLVVSLCVTLVFTLDPAPLSQKSHSKYAVYRRAAVATDVKQCSVIGRCVSTKNQFLAGPLVRTVIILNLSLEDTHDLFVV